VLNVKRSSSYNATPPTYPGTADRDRMFDGASLEDLFEGSNFVINTLGIQRIGRVDRIKLGNGRIIFKPTKRRKWANSFNWPIISHSLIII
jgi:hypothetical protein